MFVTKVKLLDPWYNYESGLSSKEIKKEDKFTIYHEITLDEDIYKVKVLLPGVFKENISIKVEDANSIIVSALNIAPQTKALFSNIYYGELFTKIVIPNINCIDVSKCSSEFKEGILTINVFDKVEKDEVKNIEIK